MRIIGFEEADRLLSWQGLAEALERGHSGPRAEMGDQFLSRDENTLLSRAAWIKGMGIAVKSATVYPGNPARGEPMIHGAMILFDDELGKLEAVIDFHLVTKWKTAADSLLAAKRLARPDSRTILIAGTGAVGMSLYEAYSSEFAGAEFLLWNRTESKAADFAARTGNPRVSVAGDLSEAVGRADIIGCATMSSEPLIMGDWLRPGQHLDLIGAYKEGMREVDDGAIARARVFVDSRASVLAHIGELKIPLERGVITEDDVIADFYDIPAGRFARGGPEEITICKNGGGAHLDLMTGRHILEAMRDA